MLAVTPPPAAPPLFVALAADDPLFGDEGFGLVQSWRDAGCPVEFHFYQSGDHGFGIKHQGTTSDHWIEEFYWWLEGDGTLKSNQSAKSKGPPGSLMAGTPSLRLSRIATVGWDNVRHGLLSPVMPVKPC